MEATTIIIAVLAVGFGLFSYWENRAFKRVLSQSAEEANRRMYELAMLKELGERTGYSLNIQNIVDVITGSLHQFIEYSAVSYMLLEPEAVMFKIHLERSVPRKFIDDVRDRMLGSLSALLDRTFQKQQVAEVVSGSILVEDPALSVRSFFNIPIIIGENPVGVITVAHTEPGHFAEEEMTILYKITQQASLAVTRLQEVVETEQRKLSAMVESITEGVVMTGLDYRIVAVNPAAKRMVGIAPGKKDVTLFDFVEHLGGKFDMKGKLEESVKLDKVLEVSEALIGEKYYQIFVAPVKSSAGVAQGEVLGGVVIFHDITHDKELERLRDDFTAMIVHELRSPLTGINKLAEVLQLPNIAADKQKRAKDIVLIYDESRRMIALVNDLLDVARLESGKFEMTKVPSDTCGVIRERATFYTAAAEGAGVTLAVSCDDRLPKTVAFDPLRIAQTLNNLISNAIKFSPAGGTVLVEALRHAEGELIEAEAKAAGFAWLWVKSEERLKKIGDAVVVAVTDVGEGIPADEIPLLFTKFKQVQRGILGQEKKGAGLGLAIAKGLVEAHGGIIGVYSREGEGSVFYFTIPLA
ncbi:MAG: ATP-binding protein [bacterium]|nr:ATP-binding protein [bacterium]